MRPAELGEKVYVLLDPAENNGQEMAVAWVTAVWAKPFDNGGRSSQSVNVRVLPDGPTLLWLTSIALLDQQPAADEIAAIWPHNPKGYRLVAFRHKLLPV